MLALSLPVVRILTPFQPDDLEAMGHERGNSGHSMEALVGLEISLVHNGHNNMSDEDGWKF
jgi:hypothetical protein